MVEEFFAFFVFVIVVPGLFFCTISLLASLGEAVVKRIMAQHQHSPTLNSRKSRRDDADDEETS